MKPLVDLTSRALARMIEGKSAEEIRLDDLHVNQCAAVFAEVGSEQSRVRVSSIVPSCP